MTTAATPLRIGVIGAGRMGADHIERITGRISNAVVSAIVEPDAERARAAAALAPGAEAFPGIEEAISAGAIDAALIATPGQFHEPVLLPALEAGLPVLCEKPLTPDPASSLRIVEAEQRLDRPRIQLGFMRRFDAEYRRLRELVASGEAGALLGLRCVHRNPEVPPSYLQDMLITDSVVHELDAVPWLAGSPVSSVEVRRFKRNSRSPEHLDEPILVLMQLEDGTLADVEMNVSIGFGYQVATEAVFERGIARIGQPGGMQLWRDAEFRVGEHVSFTTRFAAAYDEQIQRWADAARSGLADGGPLVAGPDAWDGYLVALRCDAGVRALAEPGTVVEVERPQRPGFYN